MVRYRKKVVGQTASEKNRIIKVLEDANIKLSGVLSNVDGAVGTKIIKELTDGETSVDKLMSHCHGRQKVSREEFRKALDGKVRDHHRLMLQLHKNSISDKEGQLKALDEAIDRASAAYKVEIELLQTIPGVGKASAVDIISETGADMSRFPDETHLSSWSGMSPGNCETGGKKKTVKTVHGNSHLQSTLVECGWGATRKKDCYFKRKYESLVSRRGKKKALVAVGHKIIIAVYHVIKDKKAYMEPVLHENPRKQKKQIKYYMNRLKELGVEIKDSGGRFFTEAQSARK